jgi:hypothetical protein
MLIYLLSMLGSSQRKAQNSGKKIAFIDEARHEN